MSESLKFLDDSEREDGMFEVCPFHAYTDCDTHFSASYEAFPDKPLSSRYAALEAMDKSTTQFTFEVLCHLWHLKSAVEAEEVALMFVNLGLGRIERYGKSNDCAVFSLHDLQYAYCVAISRASVNGHHLLLSRCESSFGTSNTGPKESGVDWASVCFPSERLRDGKAFPSLPTRSVSQHLGQNLFSHLCKASKDRPIQAANEMVRLLTDFRWLRGRGAAHGREGVVSDFMMAKSAFFAGGKQQQSYLSSIELLRRVTQLAPENAYLKGDGEVDLAWHIVGRLNEEKLSGSCTEFEVGLFEKLMRSTEQNVCGTWLRPRSGCLPRLSKDPRLVADISVRERVLSFPCFPIADLGDGAHILSASENGVRIHNIQSTKLALHVRTCVYGVNNVAVASCEREGSYFLFSSDGATVHVTKITKDNGGELSMSEKNQLRLDGLDIITGLLVSKNGRRVAIFYDLGTVTFLKRRSGDDSLLYEVLWRCYVPFSTYRRRLAISQSGDFVVAACKSKLLICKEKNVVGGASERKPTTYIVGAEILSIAVSQNGSSLLVGLETGVVEVWDVGSESRRDRIDMPDISKSRKFASVCVCFLEQPPGATGTVSGDRVLVGVDKSVMEYSANDLSPMTEYALSSDPLSICASVSGNGDRRIVTGCEDGSICVFNAAGAAAGIPRASGAQNVRDYVWSVVVAPKRDLILSVHESGKLSVWSASSGAYCGSLGDHDTKHSNLATCIDFSDDELFAESGCRGGTIRVWNLNSMKLRFVLHGHSNSVYDVKCAGNQRIVSSARYCGVSVWNADEGGPALKVIGAEYEPRLFVSQDGKHCFATSDGLKSRIGHLIALEDEDNVNTIDVDMTARTVDELMEELATRYSVNINRLRGRRYVKLFLDSGNVWEAFIGSGVCSDISFLERSADGQESSKINSRLYSTVQSIAAALTHTETGRPHFVIVACCLWKTVAPAVMHYVFSQ